MSKRLITAISAAALAALIATGCSGNSQQADSPTRSAVSATATGTATSSAAIPTATPSPAPTRTATAPPATLTPAPAEPLYPRGTRTGESVVDAFIDALEKNDAKALQTLLFYTAVPCKAAGQQQRFLPACPAGVSAGQALDALLMTRCEGGWVPKTLSITSDIERYVVGGFRLYAVARLPALTRPVAEGGFPAGDYLVVMDNVLQPSFEPRAAILTSRGIVVLITGCASMSPQDLVAAYWGEYAANAMAKAADFVLPPLSR